jgi:hypothetical protein
MKPKRKSNKTIRVEYSDDKQYREVVTHLSQRGFKAATFVRWLLDKLVGGESSAAEYLAAEYDAESKAADDE